MTDREQFEEAMRRVYGKGMPDAEEMQWAWQGWQAARAAPAQPEVEKVLLSRKHDRRSWEEVESVLNDNYQYAWATLERVK